MKKVIFRKATIIALILFVQLVNAQDIVFKGKIHGDLKGYDQLYMYNNVTQERDSATIVDGEFTMSIPYSVPTRYMFALQYEAKVNGGYAPFGILVDRPEVIHLEANVEDRLYKAKVTGSTAHTIYQDAIDELEKHNEKSKTMLAKEYGEDFIAKPDREDPRFASFSEKHQKLYNDGLTEVLGQMVKEHPDSYASVFTLNRMGRGLDVQHLESSFDQLNPDLKKLHEGEKIALNIQGQKNSEVGGTVIDFTMPDPEGNPVSINDFRGKYVLIDFWASWCGPCIKSFPHLRTVYEKYKNSNFEILAIDVDSNKDNWYKAMKSHPNPWPQIYDDQSISEKGFAVTAIPATFLVDPQGKIIAKNLSEEELDEKLKEIAGF